MADIYAVFGSLILLGITYPALLSFWRLILPGLVQRSHQRLSLEPWKSLGVGALTTFAAAITAGVLFAAPSQITQVLGWLWITGLLGLSSMAAAGLAETLGDHLQELSGQAFSPLGAFLRGAVVWELACVFPVIGWFLILPAGLLLTLGAGTAALIRRNRAESKKPAAETVQA